MYMVCNYQKILGPKSIHYMFGDIIYGEKEPMEDESISHGICKACYRIMMEEDKRSKEVKNEG